MKDFRITEASYTWRQMIRNDRCCTSRKEFKFIYGTVIYDSAILSLQFFKG